MVFPLDKIVKDSWKAIKDTAKVEYRFPRAFDAAEWTQEIKQM